MKKIYILFLLFLSFNVFSQEKIELSEINLDAVNNSKAIFLKFDSIVKKTELHRKYNVEVNGVYVKEGRDNPFNGEFNLVIKKNKIFYKRINFSENPFKNEKQIVSFINDAIINSIICFSYLENEKDEVRWMYDKENNLWKLRLKNKEKERLNIFPESDAVISIILENNRIKESFLNISPSEKNNQLDVHAKYFEKENKGYIGEIESYLKSRQTNNIINFNLKFTPD